ncbi:Uncharacterised protein [Mycobacterium tuberculosis]|nr:Uncharacterised protein [Mycobacterium tuberculosis]COW88886.1 Uncharacterised protein [Mycobacterium tuberculosis]COW96716.1 Uncharacterised protein [Mycobacterium tuberculosis]COX37980.1 Uncharacterised protein [Mycobacterium tuberculosis]COZ64211.1 Uncharacterised protein [Mycobacterium tuberculosis]
MRGTQHLENLVQAFLPDDIANTDVFGVFSGNSYCQVALRNFQDEILFLFPFDGPGFDRLD